MAHWEHRPESSWAAFRFGQPYAKGLARLRDEVLAKTDFDPATLWQWGTMQAMALSKVLSACEGAFGAEGQRVVGEAIRAIGLDVGRQILEHAVRPSELGDSQLTEAEFISYYATVINRIAYASLEAPKIDGAGQVSFDILWCPHQDHYKAFDCRIQRYFVEGMIEAATEWTGQGFWQVRFDSTIPAGAATCHFTLWRGTDEDRARWQGDTQLLEARALVRARTP